MRGVLLWILVAFVSSANARDDLDAILGDGREQAPKSRAVRPVEKVAEEKPSPEAPKPEATAEDVVREPEPASPAEPGPRMIEEIIVTAQKREQSVRDVPISMSVLDGEFLDEQAVTDLVLASKFIPNVSVDVQGVFTNVRMRGFGPGEQNKAFEQAVGLVIDGISYGRGQYFQSAFLDLERLEVLRGPQGTLFGRNNSAGLFNMTTGSPTDEFTGHVDTKLGEFGLRRFEAALGGPLIPGSINFRIAGLSEEHDGFMGNTTSRVVARANDTVDARDRKSFRGKLGFPDVFGASLVVAYERSDFSFSGLGSELRDVPPAFEDLLRQYDPNTDFEPKNFVSSIDVREHSNREIDILSADARYGFLGWDLAAVAGYSTLDVVDMFDPDSTPAPLYTSDSADDNVQTTFEIRAMSPPLAGLVGFDRISAFALGSSHFTAGFFYQRRRIEDSRYSIGFDPVLLAAALAATSAPPQAMLPGFPPLDLSNVPTGASREETVLFFDQTLDAFAGFGQLEWSPVDRWTLIGGGRIEHEAKEAHWERVTTEGTGILAEAFSTSPFTARDDRSELVFSPKVSLGHDWTDDVSFYAGWAKGFRAGGFNEFALNENPASLTYDSERTRSWESGVKARLLGGAAQMNVGLFWMNLEGFQLLTTDPASLDQRVVNAGEARARGVEADATWLPTGWLSILGALGLNDSEFLDFPLGNCSTDRQNTDGDEDDRCDQTGLPLFRAPEWTITLAANIDAPLASVIPDLAGLTPWATGIDFFAGLTSEYQDVQRLAPEGPDPRLRQGSFFRFDASLGFGNLARGWSLRVLARNLTDTFTATRIAAIPVLPASFWHTPEPPRTIFGELRLDF